MIRVCRQCGWNVSPDEPVIFVKVPTMRYGSYRKIPVCFECVPDDQSVWGYWQSVVNGKALLLRRCVWCNRQLLLYAEQYENVYCSPTCSRKARAGGSAK